MKNNLVWIYLLFAFYLFQPPSICAEENKVANKNVITVEFKLVCDNSLENCEKAALADTKEELYVQKTPVITLEDIASAEASSAEVPQNVKNMLKKIGRKSEPSIELTIKLNSKGKTKLNEITSQNIGKRMAIFIDGDLVLAPLIREPISVGECFISYTSFEKAKSVAARINQAKKLGN